MTMDQRDPQNVVEIWRQWAERARINGREVWLELLRDRNLWNESPEWAQDQAILAASEKLGRSFQYIGSEIFECCERRHRLASFRFLGSEPEKNPLSPRSPLDWVFRLIPGGTLLMGPPQSDFQSENALEPIQKHVVSALLVAATPTSQAMWLAFNSNNPSFFKGEALPVEQVSWDDVKEWVATSRQGLRIPREIEWLYAGQAGAQSCFYFGDDPRSLRDYAWFNENANHQTQPVAGKKPNSFGLYDIHGNVWEWCEDSFQSIYESETPRDAASSKGSDDGSASRVRRGGGWSDVAPICRFAFRPGSSPDDRLNSLGFRLFRGID